MPRLAHKGHVMQARYINRIVNSVGIMDWQIGSKGWLDHWEQWIVGLIDRINRIHQ